ncbi:MAG: ATP-binding cassette domain-containing protein [Acidimicrobiia bacterium]|nr:ATP-binding cassette domain-containing protein [Acidimicrobiia bacterium]
MSNRAFLSVHKLTAGYGAVVALRDISLSLDRGETVAIIGTNGAGKTTLLRSVVGLVRPRSGTVLLDGRDVTDLEPETMVGAGVVLVPEGRHVFPGLTVRDNLLLGRYHRRRLKGRSADLDEVTELFPALATRMNQMAGTLSGGEQQMLALGRGLMAAPEILLLDEPSLGLAPVIVSEVMGRVAALADAGTTILLVEQNVRAALRIADRGYVIENGETVLEADSDTLLRDERVTTAYLGGD